MCLKIDTLFTERKYLKKVNYPYSTDYRNNIIMKLQKRKV